VILLNRDFGNGLLQLFKEEHSAIYFEACCQLLKFLPMNETLQVMSADPTEFWRALESEKNPFEIQYYLAILEWRLSSKYFANRYKSLRPYPIFAQLLEAKEIRSLMCGNIVRILARLGEPAAVAYAKPLLLLLHDDFLPNESKIAISEYLKDHYDESVSVHIADLVPTIEKILLVIVPPVWDVFQQFLWHFQNSEPLFDMAVRHLDDNRLHCFSEIVEMFRPKIEEIGDPRQRFARSLTLPRHGEHEDVSGPLLKLLRDESNAFSESVDMLRELLKIFLETNLPDRAKIELYEAVSILSHIAPENKTIVSEFIDRVCGLSVECWSVSSQFMGGRTGLKGFRNLGATCYINSILQQCFRIPAFQYLLLDADAGDSGGLRVLQVLLHYALRSKRPFCDPKTFIQL
jgi:hypothetical protein